MSSSNKDYYNKFKKSDIFFINDSNENKNFNLNNSLNFEKNSIKSNIKINRNYNNKNLKSNSQPNIFSNNNINNNHRNLSNRSTIFNHLQNYNYFNDDYYNNNKNEIISLQSENQNYNPDLYFPSESASERFSKEYFDSEKKYNFNKSIKGNFFKEENKINNEGHEIPKPNPLRKIINWNSKNSANVNYYYNNNNKDKSSSTSKINRNINQQSNIFHKNIDNNENLKKIQQNLKEKRQQKNLINNNYNLNNNNNNNINNNKYDFGSYKSKWTKCNLDWKDPNTEIMFRKNDNENLSAKDRKIKELSESVGFNYNNNYLDNIQNKENKNNINFNNENNFNNNVNNNVNNNFNNENNNLKYKNNISTSNLYDDKFYERNYNLKNNFKNDNNNLEHEFKIINNNNNNNNNFDEISFKKNLLKEGIHIYNLKYNSDNKNITFNIRENNNSEFINNLNKIQNLLKKEDKKIEPMKKICVNKKYNPTQENNIFGIKQVFPDYEINKKNNIKENKEKNSNFTNEFQQINFKYKNNHIKNYNFIENY